MPHPYFDPESKSPTPAEIKAMGMTSRIRTLMRRADACPDDSPSHAAAFVDAIKGYDANALALVGLRLAQNGRTHLLAAMHTAGLRTWPAADTLLALFLSETPSPFHVWDMACVLDIRQDLINQTSGRDFRTLPLEGWVWFAQQAARDPASAFDHLTSTGFVHSGLLHGQPALANEDERAAYGAAIATLYKALHDHKVCHTRANPLSAMLPKAGLRTPPVLSERDHLFVALLAGWPVDAIAHAFPKLSYGKDTLGAHDARYEAVFHTLTTAHGQVRLAAKINALSPRARHLAIARLRDLQELGVFNIAARLRVLASDATLSALFLAP